MGCPTRKESKFFWHRITPAAGLNHLSQETMRVPLRAGIGNCANLPRKVSGLSMLTDKFLTNASEQNISGARIRNRHYYRPRSRAGTGYRTFSSSATSIERHQKILPHGISSFCLPRSQHTKRTGCPSQYRIRSKENPPGS